MLWRKARSVRGKEVNGGKSVLFERIFRDGLSVKVRLNRNLQEVTDQREQHAHPMSLVDSGNRKSKVAWKA